MLKYLRSLVSLVFLPVLLWLGSTGCIHAQGTSNKGTDFWVAYTGHVDGTNSRLTLFITSQQNAVVNIDAGGSVLPVVNVTANQAVSVLIDPTVRTNTYVGSSDVVEVKKGIHVTSDVPVVVYSLISFAARSAATLILPTKALGNEYYAMAYNQIASSGNEVRVSEFTIVGVEDGTTVEIIPTVKSTNNLHLPGVPFTKTLNKGDIYQYQSDTDVTGSKIKTVGNCKPVAVFSGSTKAGFCVNTSTGSGQDNLYQQLFPLSAWGKIFITSPFYNATKGVQDIFRIYVSEDNTTIKINGSTTIANSTPLNNPYAKGSIVTFFGSIANEINSNNPISVAQLQVSQSCNPNNTPAPVLYPGDPEMTILNPVEQTLKDVTLFSALRNLTTPPTNITSHYINIMLKTVDLPTLRLDGVSPTGTTGQINSEYSYMIVNVTASSNTNPTHRITCDNGFSAIAYGYGGTESYAYLAGADIKNLNANIQIYERGNVTAKSSVCSGKDYDVTLQLPYITDKIVWNLNNGALIETVNPVAPAPSIVNGSPAYFYQYKLPASSLTSAGIYSLIATVTNPVPTSCSADEEVITSFEVLPVPSASFTSNKQQSCVADSVMFTDTSNPNSSTIAKWYWNFGDGSSEVRTSADPFQHMYAASGDYQITLTVESDAGCQSSPAPPVAIHINKLPTASFAFPSLRCETKPVQFTDKSEANEGAITRWNWNFNDGNTSAEQNPSHTFASAGKYMVKLSVETEKGCLSTVDSMEVTVHPLPKVDFDVPDFCLADGSAQFTNTTTISDGADTQLTYLWDFGDQAQANAQRPNTSPLKNASHRYTKAGRYTVTLTVKSGNGCEETISQPFVVNGGVPKADFAVKNANSLCSDKAVEFEDNIKVELDEEVTKIEWIYDLINNPNTKETDDTPATRGSSVRVYSHKYPAFTFPASKTYQVKMLAYTGGSCVHTITKTITVLAVPAVDFELPAACLADGTAVFKDKSTIANTNGPFTYLWDFGDQNATVQKPNTSTDKDPSHVYSASGDYTVTLTVTSSTGCSSTISKMLTVSGSIPKAAFTVVNTTGLCGDAPVVFEDRTSIDFGEITKVEWYYDYGNEPLMKVTDDSPAKRSDPPKQYPYNYPVFYTPATKTLNVRMVAYSGTSCVDDELQTIILHAVPEVQFDAIPDVCSDGSPIQLTQAKEKNAVLAGTGTYTGKGITPGGVFDPTIAGVGMHTLTYTFVADNGCIDLATQTITVNEIPTATIGPDLFVLDGGRITLPAAATGSNLTYKWTPSTYLDQDNILNPVTTPSDDITYTLTVTTDKGCTAASQIFIKVLKFPEVPNSFTPNGDGINDTWNIKYLESYPDATLEIFNRYGERLFKFTNYLSAWDGTMNGSELPAGTYYYILNPKNGRKIISGSITILR